MGQIIDIGDIWETQCPQGCSCEIQKFSDLPLHQWTIPRKWSNVRSKPVKCFSFSINKFLFNRPQQWMKLILALTTIT